MSKFIIKTPIEKCLDELEYHGRKGYDVPVSKGQAIGGAIYPFFTRAETLNMCAEILEQNNFHETCAQVRALKEIL